MNRASTSARLSRALDWAGLVPSALLLEAGIGEYQENGSVLWPAGGVLLVLVNLGVVWRGRARGNRGTVEVP